MITCYLCHDHVFQLLVSDQLTTFDDVSLTTIITIRILLNEKSFVSENDNTSKEELQKLIS
jgi:hypothetical protein